MPELPEVETVRRDLAHEVVGKCITRVEIEGARTVRRHDAQQLLAYLPGQRVTDVRRKGKFLIVDLDEQSLLIHLRMSGQLLWVTDLHAPTPKHTHARLGFDSGDELRFVDPRTFGELWLTSHELPDLRHIGPDALDELSVEALRERMGKRRRGLKTLLLDQNVVAGIGNIYSDEILWVAKLRWDRLPGSLTRPTWRRLFDATHEVLEKAIVSRGSSLADEQYVDLYGQAGRDQHQHRVYGREGKPCERCGRVIQRIKVGGRSSYFCSHCQR